MGGPAIGAFGRVSCRTSWKWILHSSITSSAVFGVSFLILELLVVLSEACLMTCGKPFGMMFSL